ncbi:MAG: acetyl-CoA carboxylase biotin carboxyl carrier protein subunit [bacterium]|nr:acetyl-CoA carboxylase biotin carboxyl carrier protein subunit [bacterium]
MKYTAILNNKEREIDIVPLEGNRFKITIDGEAAEIDAIQCADGVLSLLMGNHSYDISFSNDETGVLLNSRNRQFDIEILDERKQRKRLLGSGPDASGPEIIKTSMPGKVIKMLVEKGQVVEPGTSIIIVEAMKMENELKCSRPGIVKSIDVTVGESIESNVTLVVIEEEIKN